MYQREILENSVHTHKWSMKKGHYLLLELEESWSHIKMPIEILEDLTFIYIIPQSYNLFAMDEVDRIASMESNRRRLSKQYETSTELHLCFLGVVALRFSWLVYYMVFTSYVMQWNRLFAFSASGSWF